MSRITEFYRISAPAPGREMDDASRSKYYRRLRLQAFVSATLGYSLYSSAAPVSRHEEACSRQRIARRFPVGRYRLGAALRLRRRQVRKRIHRRLLQHQTLHGHGTHRLGCRKRPDGTAGAGAFRSSHGRDIRGIRRHVGTERMGAVHGSAPGHHIPLAVVSPQRARNLLRILLRKPQPRGVLLVPLRWLDRDIRRLAGRVLRLGARRSHRRSRRPLLAPRHPRIQGSAARRGSCPRETRARRRKVRPGDSRSTVLRTPAVWVLAAASAFMYISRYAINGWGVLFLQEAKGFSDVEAISIVSINALLGILGTVLSGWFSDKLFQGRPQDSRTDIRRIELRGAGAVPLRR